MQIHTRAIRLDWDQNTNMTKVTLAEFVHQGDEWAFYFLPTKVPKLHARFLITVEPELV